MLQFVRDPMRLNSLVNPVLVNKATLMHNAEVGQPFSNSKHCSVDFTVSINVGVDDAPVHTNDIQLNEINW